MTAQAGIIPGPGDWHGSAELHRYFVCNVFTSEPLQAGRIDSVEVAGAAVIVAEGRFRVTPA